MSKKTYAGIVGQRNPEIQKTKFNHGTFWKILPSWLVPESVKARTANKQYRWDSI